MTCSIVRSEALAWLRAQDSDSCDLIFGSPPYVDCRLYLENGENLDIAIKDPNEWAAWMVQIFHECRRVCKGLVAFVVDGKTADFAWNAAPALLMADLYRAGFNLRKPPVFHRIGIPGSGGPDWFRGDCEFIVCTTRPGKLPWSDNRACGHPPKWAPGGEMSNRMAPTQIHVKRDKAVRIDNNGMSETQSYVYEPDDGADVEIFRKTRHGYRKSGGGAALRIGDRNEYHDYSS